MHELNSLFWGSLGANGILTVVSTWVMVHGWKNRIIEGFGGGLMGALFFGSLVGLTLAQAFK